MKFEWEQLDGYTRRAKVFGGWILESREDIVHERDGRMDSGWDWRITTVFIPDPGHEWTIDKEGQSASI